jgi:hypothetical protein
MNQLFSFCPGHIEMVQTQSIALFCALVQRQCRCLQCLCAQQPALRSASQTPKHQTTDQLWHAITLPLWHQLTMGLQQSNCWNQENIIHTAKLPAGLLCCTPHWRRGTRVVKSYGKQKTPPNLLSVHNKKQSSYAILRNLQRERCLQREPWSKILPCTLTLTA